LDDIFSTFDPIPRPTPWGNGGDVGKDPESGLAMLEDEYFIIYYPDGMTKKARLTLQSAHEAIPRMEEIIGKYYYPDDMNGRKVPIYLSKGQEDFDALLERFGCQGDFTYVVGMTIYQVSPSGVFLEAIVLKGSHVFQGKDNLREVLWHEMTHYCFGASLDYNQRINLPQWCTEGIAEYTGIVDQRPKFTVEEIEMMRKECHLDAPNFKYVFEIYRGGHSIFCHMEDQYKAPGVKAFLQTLYSKGIPASLQENFSTSLADFEADWKNHLDDFKQ
jgi:hypothetical protein